VRYRRGLTRLATLPPRSGHRSEMRVNLAEEIREAVRRADHLRRNPLLLAAYARVFVRFGHPLEYHRILGEEDVAALTENKVSAACGRTLLGHGGEVSSACRARWVWGGLICVCCPGLCSTSTTL
jgi:hypothetical protein